MASISVPTLLMISIGTTAVAGGLAAYESHEQGVAAANTAKQKARVEADNATQKQISMRQNMLRALSSQNAASLGAVGTGADTGFGANTKRQLTQGQNDLMVNSANSSAQVSLLDQEAQNARAAGDFGAAADLLGTGSKVAGGYSNLAQYNASH